MHPYAVAMLAAAASASPAVGPSSVLAPGVPERVIELEGNPLRVAALSRGPNVDVLLLRGRELERFRIGARGLVRTGAFRAPTGDVRPLLLDAAPNPAGGDPLVTVVFGEDVQSVDRGADTWLHAFVLTAGEDGGLRPISDDLGAWLRLVGGRVLLQRRGTDALVGGPVRRVEGATGPSVPGAEVPWGRRGLLEATPLPGGVDALAWNGGNPTVVKVGRGARVPGGSILGDLGTIGEPTIAIRMDRPIHRGVDREGRTKDTWLPLPRRVSVAADGAAYTVRRERSKSFFGKTSGQDSLVRLDWSGSALSVSRPYPGVDAFVIDFALVDLPGRPLVALLLVNEKEDGSGRAHLLFQEPRDNDRP